MNNERRMDDHSADVTWTFVVPPKNDYRLVIMQRRDGPFRGDMLAGHGHYYTGEERLDSSRGWVHVAGSSTGGHHSYGLAHQAASDRWEDLARLASPPPAMPASGVEKTCSYPHCHCPFDAPADPNWCARGLPKPGMPRAEGRTE